MNKVNIKDLQTNIILREIKIEDYEEIVKLQKACFPKMEPWSKDELKSHVLKFPEGQLCVEYEGKIIGSASSLIVQLDEYDEAHTFNDISNHGYINNHDPEGDTLYGIEVMVHPEFRAMKIGRRLYEARKKLAMQLNLKRIVVGGRMPSYKDYSDKVVDKSIYDPVLTFQLANGFVLKKILSDYLEEDTESKGYGTLLEWINYHYVPEKRRKYISAHPVRICVIQYQMRKINSFDDFADQCEYFVDVASGYKSDFALFPEIFTLQLLSFMKRERPGISVRKLANYTPQYIDLFHNLAIKYNVNIIAGSHFALEDDNLYNISYLFHRNGNIDKQYKLHITPNERKWWGVQPGNKLDVFNTDSGKISIQICYDVEFPELGRIAADKGAHLLFVPFCTDERQGYLRVYRCAMARAIENQMYVAIAGNVGNLPQVENMDINYAQSGIYTPSDYSYSRDGIAGECAPNIETVVVADVDLEVLKRGRENGTVINLRDRRDDLYKIVNRNC